MIKIAELNKVYRSRKSKDHYALQDINLILPDKGLIFVLGKSGSGKSTLLNLIGGLDRATSGQIVVDGNDISQLPEKAYVHYRNHYVGFIFQDHHLVDDLTVYENIKLVLNLRNIRDKKRILHALEQVGLAGYENRYPRELSGGERQRVAIARAIVKNPRIVLADEPTGNLDEVNARGVMAILKDLSQRCLVLTVSHNTAEVYANADRIISLSEGKIVQDQTRNAEYQQEPEFAGDTLIYPEDRLVTEADAALINGQLENGRLRRLEVRRDKFLKTPPNREKGKWIQIENTTLHFGHMLSLSMAFLKTKLKRIVAAGLTVSFILVILLLTQTYIHFDANRIIQDQMEQSGKTAIILNKLISLDGYQRNARICHVPVDKEDIRAFQKTGFEGEMYPILNLSVPVTSYKNASGMKKSYFDYGVLINESLGTVIVDEAFLQRQFGEVTYLAKAETFDSMGVVITDYLADVILNMNPHYKGKTYADLLGSYQVAGWPGEPIVINGILSTGYRERYQDLLDRVMEQKITDITVLYGDEEFQRLSNEIYGALSYAYSFNSNYIADYLKQKDHAFAWSYKLCFNNETEYTPGSAYVVCRADDALTSGQVAMSFEMYNTIFGTAYTKDNLDTFVPHTATMTQYNYHDTERAEPLFSVKVCIAKLCDGGTLRVAEDVSRLFARNHIRQTGVYLDGIDHVADVLDVAEERGFSQESLTEEGILTITRAVQLFLPLFQLMNIGLCIGVVMTFVNLATKMIRDKLHEIGILKALGTGNGSITFIFGLQIILVAVFTAAVSTLGYYYLVDFANTVLIESMKRLAPSQLVLDLDIMVFHHGVLLTNGLLLTGLTLISMLTPMLRIRKIQPVKIINTRD